MGAEAQRLTSHSDDYIQSEEERLTTGLDRLGWDIDAFNTLQLIAGTGRIERVRPPFADARVCLLTDRSTSCNCSTSC